MALSYAAQQPAHFAFHPGDSSGNTGWNSAGSGYGTVGNSAGTNTGYYSTAHGGALNGTAAGGGGFHQNMPPTRAAMCLVTTGGQ